MTVATEVSQIDYVGNGVATAFPVPFPFTNVNQVVATLRLLGGTVATTQVLGVHYSLVGALLASGTLTMVTSPPVGSTLHIERSVPIIQATAFRAQGSFSPATHENALDYLTFVCQQLQRTVAAGVPGPQGPAGPAGGTTVPAPGTIPVGTIHWLEWSATNADNAARHMNPTLVMAAAQNAETRILIPYDGVIQNLYINIDGTYAAGGAPGLTRFTIRKNGVANNGAQDTALEVQFLLADVGLRMRSNLTASVAVVAGDYIGLTYNPVTTGGAFSAPVFGRAMFIKT